MKIKIPLPSLFITFTQLLVLFKLPQVKEIVSSWSYGNSIFLSMKSDQQHLYVFTKVRLWLFRVDHEVFIWLDSQAAEIIHNTIRSKGARRKAQPMFQCSLNLQAKMSATQKQYLRKYFIINLGIYFIYSWKPVSDSLHLVYIISHKLPLLLLYSSNLAHHYCFHLWK